jgi:hypothetical protein
VDALTLLEKATAAGLNVKTDGDKLVILGPRSAEGLAMELLAQKAEIVRLLPRLERKVGDGNKPPLDRPPASETELRRLIDYLADPVAFSSWFESLMGRSDPAEGN